MRIILSVFITAMFLCALTACNTIAGAGEDITGGANWILEKIFGKPVDLSPGSNNRQGEK